MATNEFLSKIRKPNYISDEIIKTIDMIAGARDDQLSFDKTVIGTIITTGNVENGEYWIEYQQGRFIAYARSVKDIYTPGQSVYVKVPGGNFSEKKIIEGLAMENMGLQEFHDYTQDQLNEITIFYESEANKEYGVIAGSTPENQYYEQVIFDDENTKLDPDFESIFLNYPNIKITAEFKTDFKEIETFPENCRYGLLLEFYQRDTEGNISPSNIFRIRFDNKSSFSGGLGLEYYNYAEQFFLHSPILSNELTGLKKITFFQQGFNYDTIGGVQNNWKPNIFVRNIKLSLNEIQTGETNMWSMFIKPVGYKGFNFSNNSEKISYQGVLTYLGGNKLERETCECLWFKRNPEVTEGHEKYYQRDKSKVDFTGFEQISGENVDFNTITISGDDVYQECEYRLYILYNKNTWFFKEIKLTNTANGSRFSIVKTKENEGTFLTLLDRQNYDKDKVTLANWFVALPDGTYKKCNTDKVDKININEYLLNNEATLYADIQIAENKKVYCSFKYVNENLKEDVNVVFAGPDTFFYDSSANITYNESTEELIIIPTETTTDKVVITDRTWKSPNGAILSSAPVSDSNSMLQKMWVDESNNLHFKIRKTYSALQSQNTLQYIIETAQGDTFTFNKKISFIKQGEQKSGGLTYTLVVEQCDEDGHEINYSPLIYKDSNWENIYLRPQLYANDTPIKDGDIISGDKRYGVKYNIRKIGLEAVLVEGKDFYEVTGPKDNNNTPIPPNKEGQGQYFIHFTATITDGTKDNNDKLKEYFISYYHPVLIGSGYITANDLIINNLPNSIMYSSLGDNPTYNKQPIDIRYAGSAQTNLTAPISLTPKNISITSSQSNYYIYPAAVYTGSNFAIDQSIEDTTIMGAIRIDLTQFIKDTFIIQPIAMVLSTQLTQKLEGYDGSSILAIDENDTTKVKEILHATGVGNVGGDNNSGEFVKNTINKGTIIGKDSKDSTTGFFTYDSNGIPNNYIKDTGEIFLANGQIKSDKASFSLAEDAFLYSVNQDTNQAMISLKNAYTAWIDVVTGKMVDCSFNEDFIIKLKEALGLGGS